MVHKAYKFELRPSQTQLVDLIKHAGCARYSYNWGLQQRSTRYKATGEKLNAIKLHKELNILKQSSLSWMYEISKCAPQEALRDLDKAFANFFKGLKQRKKVGYPKLKKKGRHDAFRLTGRIKVLENHTFNQLDQVQLPRIGKIRVKESTIKLRKKLMNQRIRIQSVSVSRRADRWFVCFTVEERLTTDSPQKPRGIVGVDLGLKELAVLSNGRVISNPKVLKRKLKKLGRLNRKLSRTQKGSNRRKKVINSLGRLHYRIGCQRSDLLHKLTTSLTRQFSLIVIEDLNVKGMMKNKRLSRSIADVGWGEFRRQLDYKSKWYDSTILVANRFYPSSKLCSNCGWKDTQLQLSDRVFKCQGCGLNIDRDLNAALNLQKYPVDNMEEYLYDLYLSTPDNDFSNVAVSYHETLNVRVRSYQSPVLVQ